MLQIDGVDLLQNCGRVQVGRAKSSTPTQPRQQPCLCASSTRCGGRVEP